MTTTAARLFGVPFFYDSVNRAHILMQHEHVIYHFAPYNILYTYYMHIMAWYCCC